jgi:H+/Cl- antiporter ClcA
MKKKEPVKRKKKKKKSNGRRFYYPEILKNLRTRRDVMENLMRSIPLWIASLVTGTVAVLYAKLFTAAEHAGFALFADRPWLLFIVTPAAFVISWYLVARFAPFAVGSGIPQVIAALEISGTAADRQVPRLLGLKVLLVKIASSVILVGGGGAVGREGPTIQISGALFRFVSRLLPVSWPAYSERVMILTGSAAGLAAAFNTPLGGIVFAIEELSKRHFNSFRTTLLSAVIIAGITTQMLLGPYLYLGFPKVGGPTLALFGLVVMVSLLTGFLGAGFSRLIFALIGFRRRLVQMRSKLLVALGAGLLLGAMAYFFSPVVLGSGKETIVSLLFENGEIRNPGIAALRYAGPLISFSFGGAGGVFAPALAEGASIGAAVSYFFGLQPHQANVLILSGMVGFLTAVTRSPFTSSILVLEMTDRHSVIFFLMLAGLISSSAAWVVERRSLYERLKGAYLKEFKDEMKRQPNPEQVVPAKKI